MADRRRSIAIIALGIVTGVSSLIQGAKYVLDQISRVQTGAQTIAELRKPHGSERVIDWLTTAPPFLFGWVLIASIAVLCLFVFVPSEWLHRAVRLVRRNRRDKSAPSPPDGNASSLMPASGVSPVERMMHKLHDIKAAEIAEQRDRAILEARGDEINALKEKVAEQIDRVYKANCARDEARAERDALKRELEDVTKQRDSAQADAKTALRDIDETMVPRAVAKSLAEERDMLRQQLDGITPLVLFYRRVDSLRSRLQSFRDNMEIILPSGDLNVDTDRIARAADKNSETFSRDFRPDLVRLVAEAKQRYGFVDPTLTDNHLMRDAYGQVSIDWYLEGLDNMTSKIRDMIVTEALQSDA